MWSELLFLSKIVSGKYGIGFRSLSLSVTWVVR